MSNEISLVQARRVAVKAQGFGTSKPLVSPAHYLRTVQDLGCVQIDSVNVFARSHYLPFFSRHGAYDATTLDELGFASNTPLIESRPHEVGFIHRDSWPLFDFRRRDYQSRAQRPGSWEQSHSSTLAWVLDQIRERGPLTTSELEAPRAGETKGSWWDWSDTKRAAEMLSNCGELTVIGRRGFRRVYGLTSQAIPDHILSRRIEESDAIQRLALHAVRAHGIATASDIGDYFRINRKRSAIAINELLAASAIQQVRVSGWSEPAYSLPDLTIPRAIHHATVVSPFDPLVWFRPRALRLFGMDYRIEIYTPARKREFGYYSLPVLIDDRLAARVDLKMDRKNRRLLVQSAWWHAGEHRADDAARLAQAVRDAGAWQGAEEISVSGWGTASESLASELACARHEVEIPSR